MATISFIMDRTINSEQEADMFIKALNESEKITTDKKSNVELMQQEEESRYFLRKLLSPYQT